MSHEAQSAHDVTDNTALGRFELRENGEVAYASYRRDGSLVAIPHVEAPPALRGTGAAGRLMRGVMQIAREEGYQIVPVCSYAAAWMHRHREYHDLLF